MDSSLAPTGAPRTLGLVEWLDAQAGAAGPMAALPPHVEIVLLTGLAPGTDLVLAEAVSAWMARHRRRGRHVGLLPVPAEVLWNDWLPRSGGAEPAFRQQVRARFDVNIASCDSLIRLWNEDTPHLFRHATPAR